VTSLETVRHALFWRNPLFATEPDIHYLGFMSKGFASMEAAEAAVPDFARRVLARMAELIQ